MKLNRRDRCYLVGRRAALLASNEAAEAWALLANYVERMGDRDVPKFKELLHSIRIATIKAKQSTNGRPSVI